MKRKKHLMVVAVVAALVCATASPTMAQPLNTPTATVLQAKKTTNSKKTGLYKVGKKWKYYKNGKFTKATGLVKKAGTSQWYYVEKGVLSKQTGAVQKVDDKSGKWFYVKNGKFTKSTGLAKCLGSKGWVYVKKGVLNKATGVVSRVKSNGHLYYVQNGKFVKATGVAKRLDNKKLVFVKKGIVNKTYTGTGYDINSGKKYSVKKGVVSKYQKSIDTTLPDTSGSNDAQNSDSDTSNPSDDQELDTSEHSYYFYLYSGLSSNTVEPITWEYEPISFQLQTLICDKNDWPYTYIDVTNDSDFAKKVDLFYYSSNPEIATVDNNGNVTIHEWGSVQICVGSYSEIMANGASGTGDGVTLNIYPDTVTLTYIDGYLDEWRDFLYSFRDNYLTDGMSEEEIVGQVARLLKSRNYLYSSMYTKRYGHDGTGGEGYHLFIPDSNGIYYGDCVSGALIASQILRYFGIDSTMMYVGEHSNYYHPERWGNNHYILKINYSDGTIVYHDMTPSLVAGTYPNEWFE